MPQKLKLCSDWMTGCAGCHMSLLDMDERLVTLLAQVDLRSCPITDLKHPDKEGVDIGVLEGCVNNSSVERVCRMMRSRCKILVALGDCAVFGGVPTMRNQCSAAAALRRAYVETESTVGGQIPSHEDLAVMQEARAVDQVVEVDLYIPGCPPSADAIFHALSEVAAGRAPQLKGKLLDWH